MRQPVLLANYCDPQSVLVINIKGELRRLYCPFRAFCIRSVDIIPAGSWVIVEEVGRAVNDGLIFIVNSKPYAYSHFHIIINF